MNSRPPTGQPTLILGSSGTKRETRHFTLGPAAVASHKHVMGITGSGKSKCLANICVQLMNQGIGCALVDPHGDLALDVLTLLHETDFFARPEAFDRLLYVDFSRRDRFLPFNVLRQPADPHTIARIMVETFKRAWPALAGGAAPAFENILLAAVLVLVENNLPITELPHLVTDRVYRDGLLAQVTDPQVVAFFHDRFDRLGGGATQTVESTLRRVFLLTFSPTLRYSLGQRANRLPFRSLIDRGISLICNLGGLDEETQRFLGALVAHGLEVAALSRADLPEARRRPYHLILDEFAMFSAQSEEALTRVLALCRKYGLFMTLANQTWSQVSSRLQGALQNTIGITFRLGRADAEAAARQLAQFDPNQVKRVDRGRPVYLSRGENTELWTQALQQLAPREAFVKVGEETTRIRTLAIPRPTRPGPELAQVIEQYAVRLLTPRAQAMAEVEGRRIPAEPGLIVPRSAIPIVGPNQVSAERGNRRAEDPARPGPTEIFPASPTQPRSRVRRFEEA